MANLESNHERKKVTPVVDRDRVVTTKKPLGKKFAETFLNEATEDVKTWLIMDVLIPGIKNTILDVMSMMFFGEVSGKSRSRSRSDRDRRTNYGGYYRSSSDRNDRDSRRRRGRDDVYESDDKVDFRNIVMRQRDDAERVINALRDRIHDNGSASVAELLDLIDVAGRYTDNNWGWDDERDIGIRRVSAGYLIDVAEPRYLE